MMKEAVDEILGRISALESQLEHEGELRKQIYASASESHKRSHRLSNLRAGYLGILDGLEDDDETAAEETSPAP